MVRSKTAAQRLSNSPTPVSSTAQPSSVPPSTRSTRSKPTSATVAFVTNRSVQNARRFTRASAPTTTPQQQQQQQQHINSSMPSNVRRANPSRSPTSSRHSSSSTQTRSLSNPNSNQNQTNANEHTSSRQQPRRVSSFHPLSSSNNSINPNESLNTPALAARSRSKVGPRQSSNSNNANNNTPSSRNRPAKRIILLDENQVNNNNNKASNGNNDSKSPAQSRSVSTGKYSNPTGVSPSSRSISKRTSNSNAPTTRSGLATIHHSKKVRLSSSRQGNHRVDEFLIDSSESAVLLNEATNTPSRTRSSSHTSTEAAMKTNKPLSLGSTPGPLTTTPQGRTPSVLNSKITKSNNNNKQIKLRRVSSSKVPSTPTTTKEVHNNIAKTKKKQTSSSSIGKCFRCDKTESLEGSEMAKCIACNSLCHLSCMTPPRKTQPRSIWICAPCHDTALRHGILLRHLPNLKQPGSCTECYKRSTTKQDGGPLRTCSECRLFFHESCARIYFKHSKNNLSQSSWRCNTCDPASSTVGNKRSLDQINKESNQQKQMNVDQDLIATVHTPTKNNLISNVKRSKRNSDIASSSNTVPPRFNTRRSSNVNATPNSKANTKATPDKTPVSQQQNRRQSSANTSSNIAAKQPSSVTRSGAATRAMPAVTKKSSVASSDIPRVIPTRGSVAFSSNSSTLPRQPARETRKTPVRQVKKTSVPEVNLSTSSTPSRNISTSAGASPRSTPVRKAAAANIMVRRDTLMRRGSLHKTNTTKSPSIPTKSGVASAEAVTNNKNNRKVSSTTLGRSTKQARKTSTASNNIGTVTPANTNGSKKSPTKTTATPIRRSSSQKAPGKPTSKSKSSAEVTVVAGRRAGTRSSVIKDREVLNEKASRSSRANEKSATSNPDNGPRKKERSTRRTSQVELEVVDVDEENEPVKISTGRSPAKSREEPEKKKGRASVSNRKLNEGIPAVKEQKASNEDEDEITPVYSLKKDAPEDKQNVSNNVNEKQQESSELFDDETTKDVPLTNVQVELSNSKRGRSSRKGKPMQLSEVVRRAKSQESKSPTTLNNDFVVDSKIVNNKKEQEAVKTNEEADESKEQDNQELSKETTQEKIGAEDEQNKDDLDITESQNTHNESEKKVQKKKSGAIENDDGEDMFSFHAYPLAETSNEDQPKNNEMNVSIEKSDDTDNISKESVKADKSNDVDSKMQQINENGKASNNGNSDSKMQIVTDKNETDQVDNHDADDKSASEGIEKDSDVRMEDHVEVEEVSPCKDAEELGNELTLKKSDEMGPTTAPINEDSEDVDSQEARKEDSLDLVHDKSVDGVGGKLKEGTDQSEMTKKDVQHNVDGNASSTDNVNLPSGKIKEIEKLPQLSNENAMEDVGVGNQNKQSAIEDAEDQGDSNTKKGKVDEAAEGNMHNDDQVEINVMQEEDLIKDMANDDQHKTNKSDFVHGETIVEDDDLGPDWSNAELMVGKNFLDKNNHASDSIDILPSQVITTSVELSGQASLNVNTKASSPQEDTSRENRIQLLNDDHDEQEGGTLAEKFDEDTHSVEQKHEEDYESYAPPLDVDDGHYAPPMEEDEEGDATPPIVENDDKSAPITDEDYINEAPSTDANNKKVEPIDGDNDEDVSMDIDNNEGEPTSNVDGDGDVPKDADNCSTQAQMGKNDDKHAPIDNEYGKQTPTCGQPAPLDGEDGKQAPMDEDILKQATIDGDDGNKVALDESGKQAPVEEDDSKQIPLDEDGAKEVPLSRGNDRDAPVDVTDKKAAPIDVDELAPSIGERKVASHGADDIDVSMEDVETLNINIKEASTELPNKEQDENQTLKETREIDELQGKTQDNDDGNPLLSKNSDEPDKVTKEIEELQGNDDSNPQLSKNSDEPDKDSAMKPTSRPDMEREKVIANIDLMVQSENNEEDIGRKGAEFQLGAAVKVSDEPREQVVKEAVHAILENSVQEKGTNELPREKEVVEKDTGEEQNQDVRNSGHVKELDKQDNEQVEKDQQHVGEFKQNQSEELGNGERKEWGDEVEQTETTGDTGNADNDITISDDKMMDVDVEHDVRDINQLVEADEADGDYNAESKKTEAPESDVQVEDGLGGDASVLESMGGGNVMVDEEGDLFVGGMTMNASNYEYSDTSQEVGTQVERDQNEDKEMGSHTKE